MMDSNSLRAKGWLDYRPCSVTRNEGDLAFSAVSYYIVFGP